MAVRLLLWVLMVLASPAAAEELRILVSKDAPPMGFRGDDGALIGFYPDLASAICERLKAHCIVEDAPVRNILSELAANKADIGFGNFVRTRERAGKYLFSDSLWRSSVSVIGPAGSVPLEGENGVSAGRRLAVVAGSIQNDFAVERWPDLVIIPRDTPQGILEALRDGDADLGMMHMVTAVHFIRDGRLGKLAIVGKPISEQPVGGSVYAIFPQRDVSLQKRFNDAFADLLKDGTYQQINRRWVPFDMY